MRPWVSGARQPASPPSWDRSSAASWWTAWAGSGSSSSMCPSAWRASSWPWRFVPSLTTHPHKFDIPGVLLSAVGLFLLVFGIQEGETYNWGTITGPDHGLEPDHRRPCGAGGVRPVAAETPSSRGEPLAAACRCSGTATSRSPTWESPRWASRSRPSALPLIFYYQMVRGLTPTQSALMMIPMALISGGLAPVVGKNHRPRKPEIHHRRRSGADGRGALLEFCC